jgi:hypothetical protein
LKASRISAWRRPSRRAQNVATFISLSDLEHHDGMRPQRIGTNSRLPSLSTTASMGALGRPAEAGRAAQSVPM